MREKVQQLGGFLAHMIIPNLGAFIAWGLITAFFIPTGWTPNETLAKLVGPMIVYLLPILIGRKIMKRLLCIKNILITLRLGLKELKL